MLTSLALIFLVGLCMAAICQKLKLPRIIGMLVTGMVLGPYVLDFLDSSILSISAELRKMALIIILLKAGLSLNLNDLKKVGRPAVLLAFVPASFEIVGYVLFAPIFLEISRIDAAVMGAVLAAVSKRLSEKFGKLWIAAEVILFVLVGAAVDLRYTAAAGGFAVLVIFLSLIFRMAGVFVCVLGTGLSWKERLFCAISYLPKATVQAAIGSVPLAAGLGCGKMILSVAVLAILITAPLGALGMDLTYKKLLAREENN